MTKFNVTTNNRLREIRTARHLTLRDVENATGIDNSVLCAIELGKRRLNIRVAQLLAEYFNVSIDYLLGNDINKEIENYILELLKSYNQYEAQGLTPRNASLAYIMKAVYEMDDATLQEAVNYIKYLSAKSDFK